MRPETLPAYVRLAVLIRECDEWNETAERLAVRFIRECKELEGMEPENEREEYTAATERAEQLVNWHTRDGKVTSFVFRLAQAEIRTQREFIRHFPQRKDTREPFAFFGSRYVNVNGTTLKLKWVC